MRIHVLYFASLREKLGSDGEEIELPYGIESVDAVRSLLSQRGGIWSEALAEGRIIRAALNQKMVNGAARIEAGAELAFFPPVTGG